MRSLLALSLIAALTFTAGCARLLQPDRWPIERDAVSTPAQRDAWTRWLQSRSSAPVQVRYDALGHLHGLSADIDVGAAGEGAVLEFLNGSLRTQLGLRAEESLRVAQSGEQMLPVLREGRYSLVAQRTLRVAIETGGFQELGRYIVVVLDPKASRLQGLYNAHLPALDGYVRPGRWLPLEEALANVQRAEGSAVTLQSSSQGWYAPDWSATRRPGVKDLGWLLTVKTARGNPRDYIVSASTGEILFTGPEIYYVVHQDHNSYAAQGRTYFSTLPGRTRCDSLSPPQCNDPAFTDSLVSRMAFPALTAEVEQLTTPGYRGISGVWNVPDSWKGKARLMPFQNNHLDPNTDAVKVVVAATSATSGDCGRYPPPCANQSVHIYGVGDTDASVYGHEYAHTLFAQSKILATQIGVDGQLAEGVMDISGVTFENAFLVRKAPCNQDCNTALTPRTDFVLRAPSQSFIVDLRPPAPSCGEPRLWLGRSFFAAVNELALNSIVCRPNASCGLPTRPGVFLPEQDVALEVMYSAFLKVFADTPRVQPRPEDVLAAALMTTGNDPTQPVAILHRKLSQAAGNVTCP